MHTLDMDTATPQHDCMIQTSRSWYIHLYISMSTFSIYQPPCIFHYITPLRPEINVRIECLINVDKLNLLNILDKFNNKYSSISMLGNNIVIVIDTCEILALVKWKHISQCLFYWVKILVSQKHDFTFWTYSFEKKPKLS